MTELGTASHHATGGNRPLACPDRPQAAARVHAMEARGDLRVTTAAPLVALLALAVLIGPADGSPRALPGHQQAFHLPTKPGPHHRRGLALSATVQGGDAASGMCSPTAQPPTHQGPLRVKATSKLQNRLQMLATACNLADEFSAELKIEWPVNQDCPVSFSDVFSEPKLNLSRIPEGCNYKLIQSGPGMCSILSSGLDSDICFGFRSILMPSAWKAPRWYRGLQPSKMVHDKVQALKASLQWDKHTWVAVHVMDPEMTFHKPNPEPRKPSLRQRVRTVAPVSSFMYEMMLAHEQMADAPKPLRFLLLSDHPHAVEELKSAVSPAFDGDQLVTMADSSVPLTFGANHHDGLLEAAARAFLLADADRLIYVEQSAFSTIASLISGKTSVAIDDSPEGFNDSMASVRPASAG